MDFRNSGILKRNFCRILLTNTGFRVIPRSVHFKAGPLPALFVDAACWRTIFPPVLAAVLKGPWFVTSGVCFWDLFLSSSRRRRESPGNATCAGYVDDGDLRNGHVPEGFVAALAPGALPLLVAVVEDGDLPEADDAPVGEGNVRGLVELAGVVGGEGDILFGREIRA